MLISEAAKIIGELASQQVSETIKVCEGNLQLATIIANLVCQELSNISVSVAARADLKEHLKVNPFKELN